MMNIFSIFDPSTSMSYSLNWFCLFILIMFLPNIMWFVPTRLFFIWFSILMNLFKNYKSLKPSSSNYIIFLSIFSLIFFNNFVGLFPYIFTASSHLSMTFSLSLSLWISMMIFKLTTHLNNLLTHLTPQSTPTLLMPFMVIIELISLLIQPFTLGIRLMANMIAGHLMLSLLGSSGSYIPMYYLPILLFVQFLLFILEISMSIIQAYIFSTLSILYSKN